jgi:hypothetical protein
MADLGTNDVELSSFASEGLLLITDRQYHNSSFT